MINKMSIKYDIYSCNNSPSSFSSPSVTIELTSRSAYKIPTFSFLSPFIKIIHTV